MINQRDYFTKRFKHKRYSLSPLAISPFPHPSINEKFPLVTFILNENKNIVGRIYWKKFE